MFHSIPDLDVICQTCRFNNQDLGTIRGSIRRDESNSLSATAKVSRKKAHDLSIALDWSLFSDGEKSKNVKLENVNGEPTYNREQTVIDFTLDTDDVGKLLQRWGFKPSIEDSAGKVSARLYWDNSPWRMDYTDISGSARLDFGKGYLSEISDEDGRIIALFNLKSILRKLTFDFKDVYKKGFFYDSMGGTLTLDKGVISTYDTSIKGNVADVWLFGETDLKKQTVNQHAIVSPHITSSFPVLAAWALEPTTGILVYLLNKIMEPAIDVATQIDYHVHGTFDKPIVEEIKKSSKRIKVDIPKEQILPSKNTQSETDKNNTVNASD